VYTTIINRLWQRHYESGVSANTTFDEKYTR
jgi:hypothetical protein